MSISDKNYTPKDMANKLVDTAMKSLISTFLLCGYRWDYMDFRILDPSMGVGNILNTVKNYLFKKYTNPKVSLLYRRSILEHIKTRMLYGVEIDPIECGKAKKRLGIKNSICADYLDIDTYDDDLSYSSDFDFSNKLPKMDLIIGNPPFLGGGKISSVYGDEYAKRIRKEYQIPGRADYCTYFFKKADRHLSHFGHISYIVTNTISQGATRKAGLQWMLANGYEIYNAETNVKWPGDAKVTVSIVHLRRKIVKSTGVEGDK